ncbi:MAG: hypothetical protein ACK5PD_16050 [Pirellulaceae bacterium]|jgi:hypothetical protein
MAANEILLTINLDEDDWKAIERLSMAIEKRLERLEAILDARGLDWDHPRVADEPAKKPEPEHPPDPGEGYRILSKNPPEDLSPGDEYFVSWDGLWHESSDASKGIREQRERRWYRRKIEPAKEADPEHPAGPKPDPGEGYRILSKDPPEELQPGDEYELAAGNGNWVESENARTHREQEQCIWYRRKIGTPQPPEPEYREPVLPGDCGKQCEFSDDGSRWFTLDLAGFNNCFNLPWLSRTETWRYARIKKDA